MQRWYQRLLAFLQKHRRVTAAVLAGAILLAVPVVAFALSTSDPEDNRSAGTNHKNESDQDEGEDKQHENEGEEAARPPTGQSTPAQPPAEPPAPTPASVLGLANWKLTLPTGGPDEVKQPALAAFSNQYFRLNDTRDGVIFQAHAGGATTSNSGYPRSELREMTNGGKTKASWSNASGTHTMTIRQAITHSPAVKPDVVAGQIHDASDDVIMVRLEGSRLFVESDGDDIGVLDPAYHLGTVFTVKIEASGGRIKVWYNGALKVDIARSGSGWYFKAGCYTQSNPSKGDNPNAYGEVVIYFLKVTH